jgi:hypothetical protein
MVKIIIPTYMVGEGDRVDTSDSISSIINVDHGGSIADHIKVSKLLAPIAFDTFVNKDGGLKKNVIIVYNNEIINKNSIDLISTKDKDEIEFIIQFAGG